MSQRVLLDTGPIIALLVENDPAHEACVELFKSYSGRLLTCWPVIIEAAWLARGSHAAMEALFRGVSRNEFELLHLDAADIAPIHQILATYRPMKAQLADASLVYLADREKIDTIFTLDRRDFSTYRTRRGKALKIRPDIT